MKYFWFLFPVAKVYPVSALGGVQYIAALRKPFPHIPMVASQGITIGWLSKIICYLVSNIIIFSILQTSESFLYIFNKSI